MRKNLEKLLQASAYLKSAKQTVEDFKIIRIDWAIAGLENKREEMKKYKVLRSVGLRSDLSDRVAQYLVQHC